MSNVKGSNFGQFNEISILTVIIQSDGICNSPKKMLPFMAKQLIKNNNSSKLIEFGRGNPCISRTTQSQCTS
jgi:hypothetical protein